MDLDKSDGNFTRRFIRLWIFCCVDGEYLYDYETSFPLTSSTSRPGCCFWHISELCPDGSWNTCSACSGTTTKGINTRRMRASFHSAASLETSYKIVFILQRKKKITYFAILASMSSFVSSVPKACTSSLTLWKIYGSWRRWVILLLQSVYHFCHLLTSDIFTSTEISGNMFKRKNILSSLTKHLHFLHYNL